MLTANCLPRMRCSDEAEKGKNAPQVFPGFRIIKLARHCGKITIFQSDDAENGKNAPQVFPGFPIIKLARHCGKITFFLKNVRFMGTVSGPAGCFCLSPKG